MAPTKKPNPTRRKQIPIDEIREAARTIDQAIGQGQRMLELVDLATKTPPTKLVGVALQGIGKMLVEGRFNRPRR